MRAFLVHAILLSLGMSFMSTAEGESADGYNILRKSLDFMGNLSSYRAECQFKVSKKVGTQIFLDKTLPDGREFRRCGVYDGNGKSILSETIWNNEGKWNVIKGTIIKVFDSGAESDRSNLANQLVQGFEPSLENTYTLKERKVSEWDCFQVDETIASRIRKEMSSALAGLLDQKALKDVTDYITVRRYFIRKVDLAIVGSEWYSGSGSQVFSSHYEKFDVNPNLSDSDFMLPKDMPIKLPQSREEDLKFQMEQFQGGN
jgi:hypothetical protein